MTGEEFEQQYAQMSGVTVKWLHLMGKYAAPCYCDEPDCQGWQMAHKTKLKTSFTISPLAKQLLSILASRRGLSHTAVLEILIRSAARAEGVNSDELARVEGKPEEQE